MTQDSARQAALTHLLNVIQAKQSLTQSFLEHPPADNDKSLVKAMTFGVLRWYWALSHVANGLIHKPLKDKDHDVYLIIVLGLYQLQFMRIAPHAVVSLTVDLTSHIKKPWAKGFVNAVLRHYLRDQASLSDIILAHHTHPKWLFKAISSAWPDKADAIFQANNAKAPLVLRVNEKQSTCDEYHALCEKEGFALLPVAGVPSALRCVEAVDVTALPRFSEGAVSVQDSAAQCAAPLLAVEPGHRVLDACAAPGGKTAHILEASAPSTLLALDKDKVRVKKLDETLSRLKLSAHTQTAQAELIDTWWDGELFDRILLDVPCSGTGVIRRHPDIKHLRRADDIAALVEIQRNLLLSLWKVLKPGGKLLYTTCSVFPEENRDNITHFLSTHTDATHLDVKLPFGFAETVGWQVLPDIDGPDGFYYALLQKNA